MPPAGRLKDIALVPRDCHGCGDCPHSAFGPSITASANVAINHLGALRVGDRGRHERCCGDGSWRSDDGAPFVLINDRAAHRKGDATVHCGGVGKLEMGSPNVLIGNHTGNPRGKGTPPPILLRDMPGPLGAPRAFSPWVLMHAHTVIERGRSDSKGSVDIKSTLQPDALYTLHYPGGSLSLAGVSAAPISTMFGVQLRLSVLGYGPRRLTGKPCADTRRALIEFQNDAGLEPTGLCDDLTRQRIRAAAGF